MKEMESKEDNKKFLHSREEGIMTENTVNLKRDICKVIKKEIFLVYYIFIY